MKFTIIILFFCLNVQSELIKHESIGARLHDYSFQEFCSTMKAKESLLITPIGLLEIECFNQKFNISDFCLKKLPLDAAYSRGFANTIDKKVYCEEAESVMLSIDCLAKPSFCKNAEQTCEALKKNYAVKLETTHSSILNKKINCYFSKNSEEKLNEL